MSDRPSTIAHLSTATTWRGGEQQALYLAEGLKARGASTVVLAQPGSPMAERSEAAGLTVEPVATGFELNPLGWWAVARALKKHGAAAVHAHDAHAVALAAFAGRMAGVRRLCTRRVDFDLKSVWKYTWGMERVICISEAIRSICRNAGVPEAMMPVVPSGIDLDRIQSAPSERAALLAELVPEAKKKPLLLLNVASLTDHKGQTYLLQAMPRVLAKLPQTHLVVVGTGELEGALHHQAHQLALEEDVTFAGFRDDVPALLKAADLFVMSSHLEGLCTSAMDALAAGTPVVATRAGGLPEVVEHESTGLLVPPKDPDALADALLALLSERKRREHMGRNAAREAGQRFSRDAMAEGTLAVYRDMELDLP